MLGDSLRNVQWNESISQEFKGFSTSGHGCYRCLDTLTERIQKHPFDRVHRIQGSVFDANSPSSLGCTSHDRVNQTLEFPGYSTECETMCLRTPRNRCRAWTAYPKNCCRFTFASRLMLQEAGKTVKFPESLFSMSKKCCSVTGTFFVQVESGHILYTKSEVILGSVPLAFARDDFRVVNTREPSGANPYYRMSDVPETSIGVAKSRQETKALKQVTQDEDVERTEIIFFDQWKASAESLDAFFFFSVFCVFLVCLFLLQGFLCLVRMGS